MLVKEMLLNALSNAGHIHEGEAAEADEIALALRLFNSEMKSLSGKNLICAYQKVLDIESMPKAEVVVGSFTPKKGVRIFTDVSGVNVNTLVKGRDYAFFNDRFHTVFNAAPDAKAWIPCSGDECCTFIPDIVCDDMERIVSFMSKDSSGKWSKMNFVPLTSFYTDDNGDVYCTSAAGENKVRVLVKDCIVGKPVKVIYNSEMRFGKNDVLELPDAHCTMVELAVTVAILRKDGDSDPTKLQNYTEQLKSVMNDIASTTVTERRIVRESETSTSELLFSGLFIRRR